AANAAFAVSVDPDNDALQTRVQKITALRADGKPTVPTQIGLERATNPFLRPHDTRIRAQLDMAEAADVDVFAEIRARKDNF
ncbi:MAG: hydroxyacylglutathione hydrolase C-terminal domain-containing protein, partial [Pseudomonadota bacterium]|nr:hydroxyacylglutathione hydrolase C-terminal domain-containing protein [Pseudomonadota bacterium]